MKPALSIFLAICMAAALNGSAPIGLSTGPRTAGPMPQHVYVWQRAWTPEVLDAVDQSSPDFATYIVLAAEVSFHSGHMEVARVGADFSTLRRTGRPVGLALRIGPYTRPFAADDAIAKRLADLSESLVEQATAAGTTPAELQIDFDCAASKLEGYRKWVGSIRRRVAPTPVTITALPSWLDRTAFASLVRAADGYVLQVHSLQRPTSISAPMTLCDPAAARGAVERAARIGVPFRVALPTYGYLVAFDETGGFRGISAEGQPLTWPESAQIRPLHADPSAIAALVAGWTTDRPASLTGIIWYRLPTDADELNWRWVTLQSVMKGRVPCPRIEVAIKHSDAGLFEISLHNAGDADAPVPAEVRVRWQGTVRIASDALAGFSQSIKTTTVAFRPPATAAIDRLAPGDRRMIGWLRLSEDKEVHADVTPAQP